MLKILKGKQVLSVVCVLLFYFGNVANAAPSIASPASGSTLQAGDNTFKWAGNDSAPVGWWVYLGSSLGYRDYLDTGELSAATTTTTIGTLPRDGSDVFARLWYKPSDTESWKFVDTTYKAAGSDDSGSKPTLSLDPASTTISNSTQRVSWSSEGLPVTQWWLYAGSSAGKHDLYDSGRLTNAAINAATINNLPMDGSSVHFRLWYRVNDARWQAIDQSFTTVNQSDPPTLTQPKTGDELSSNAQLQWKTNGTTVTGWWVYAGSSAGSKNLFDSGMLQTPTQSLELSGLPRTGETVHVTLWYRDSSSKWLKLLYSFKTKKNTQTFPNLQGYDLVFRDEFSGNKLDPDKWDTALLWGPYVTINNEDQLYIDSLGMHADIGFSPFEMTGSTLKITASKVSASEPVPPRPPRDSPLWKPRPYSEYGFNDPVGQPGDEDYNPGFKIDEVDYLSGMITSYGSFKMTHGYVEMRAKLPAGRGLWPAFWMLPIHYVKDVPEIDVMEFLGQDVDTLYHTYHYFDPSNDWELISTPSYISRAVDWTKEFHTFGMAWSPGQIVWYVNGVEAVRIDSDLNIANQPMYLLANVAVGGNWPGPADSTTKFPATFEIDYIRAYEKKLSQTLNLAADYQLMFSDEFNGSQLDPSKWNTHFLWGPYLPINDEKQYYVDALGSDAGGATPFSLANGELTITARTENDASGFKIPQRLPAVDASVWTNFPTFQRNTAYSPGSYTSGILTSYDAFNFANGYAEIRAKVPSGDGLTPAFWLLNGYYVGDQPEIDVMALKGENPREAIHSFHRIGPNGWQTDFSVTTGGDTEDGYANDYHRYGVRWRSGQLDWYIDDQKVFSYEGDDVAYQVMYVLASLAVGAKDREIDDTSFPASMAIDYIRVYQEKDFE